MVLLAPVDGQIVVEVEGAALPAVNTSVALLHPIGNKWMELGGGVVVQVDGHLVRLALGMIAAMNEEAYVRDKKLRLRWGGEDDP